MRTSGSLFFLWACLYEKGAISNDNFIIHYPMNANMTGFRSGFQKSLHFCALDINSLSIGRVKGMNMLKAVTVYIPSISIKGNDTQNPAAPLENSQK